MCIHDHRAGIGECLAVIARDVTVHGQFPGSIANGDMGTPRATHHGNRPGRCGILARHDNVRLQDPTHVPGIRAGSRDIECDHGKSRRLGTG